MLAPTFSDLKINSCRYLLKMAGFHEKSCGKKGKMYVSGPYYNYETCTFASTQQSFLEKSINIPYLKSVLSSLHFKSSNIPLWEHYLTLHQ